MRTIVKYINPFRLKGFSYPIILGKQNASCLSFLFSSCPVTKQASRIIRILSSSLLHNLCISVPLSWVTMFLYLPNLFAVNSEIPSLRVVNYLCKRSRVLCKLLCFLKLLYMIQQIEWCFKCQWQIQMSFRASGRHP